MWSSLTSRTIVNTTVVIAEIAGYPELWQLHNKTLGLYLAKSINNKYLVYYNVYENTIFCDWKRIIKFDLEALRLQQVTKLNAHLIA
jgi:hypothetical protein